MKRLEDAFDKAVADFQANTDGTGIHHGFRQTKAMYQMGFVRRLYYHETGLIVDSVLNARRYGVR